MKHARLLLALGALTAGCAGLIGVPDLDLTDSANGIDSGAPDGAKADGTTNDGSTTPPDGATSDATTGSDSGEDGSTTSCAGTAVDFTTDKLNCGRCGHSCGGGGCIASACQPVTLAASLPTPFAIDVDATYVYFPTYNNPGTIQRVPKAATENGSAQVIVTPFPRAVGVHVDGTSLYYSGNTGVFRCDVTGGAGGDGGVGSCGATAVRIAANQDGNDDFDGEEIVTSSSGTVYFADDNGSIYRMQPDGGALTAIVKDMTHPFSLAVGGGFVYVASQENFINRFQLDGGSPTLPGPQPSLYDDTYVTADDTGAFWAYVDENNITSGFVYGGTHASGNGQSLATNPGQPIGVAVDAQFVYWTDGGDGGGDFLNPAPATGNGRLLRCPRAGCAGDPATVLATGLIGGGPIALDDAFIYWVENNYENAGARIRKVAKP